MNERATPACDRETVVSASPAPNAPPYPPPVTDPLLVQAHLADVGGSLGEVARSSGVQQPGTERVLARLLGARLAVVGPFGAEQLRMVACGADARERSTNSSVEAWL